MPPVPDGKLQRLQPEGWVFVAARDRVAAEPRHAKALTDAGQTSTFAALSGP